MNIAATTNPTSLLQPAMYSLIDIYGERDNYINCLRMYSTYFHVVPNVKVMNSVDTKKASAWLEEEYKDQVSKKHYKQKYDAVRKTCFNADVIYILNSGVMVDFESNYVYIVFSCELEQQAQDLFESLQRFIRVRKRNSEISLVVRGLSGLQTTSMKLKKPYLQIDKTYNDDFAPIHSKIVKTLRKKDKSGLILLHGAPGTGKSTYIRYLIHHLNKPVIFIPPSLAMDMDNPGFMEFMIENKNSVLVIEDAEQLIVSRGNNRTSSISMLLNITDGLLGECLGIQVIATFNTNLSDIDKALMRKGRLTALYEFKPLSIQKSKALLEDIGIANYVVTKEMTVADIYNIEEDGFELQKNKQPIGFRVRVA
jgi:hypothetical protein